MTYTRAILSAVIDSSRGRLIGLAVFAAYVMAPTDAGGLIHGIPLGGIDAAALIAIGWLAIAGGRLRFASVAAAAMVVFWIAAYAIPGSAGFRARYYSDATASIGHERSTEFKDSAFTRVDRRLRFGRDAAEFPLPFFNDPSRFNF